MATAVMVAEEQDRALENTDFSTLETAKLSLTLLALSCFRLLLQRSCRMNYCALVRETAALV